MSMSIEQDTLILQRYFQVWNTKDSTLAQAVVSPSFVSRFGDRGPKGFLDTVHRRHTAFLNANFRITDIVPLEAIRSVYFVWYIFTGIYQGAVLPGEAVGKAVEHEGVAMYEIVDGQVIGLGSVPDVYKVLPEQLGVLIPEDRGGEF